MEQSKQLEVLWSMVRTYMGEKITTVTMNKWIDVLEPLVVQNRVLVLQCPDVTTRDTINKMYSKLLTESIIRANPQVVGFLTCLPNERWNFLQKQPVGDASEYALNHKYTFDTFVVGSSNHYAHAACQAVAQNPGKAYNPLFLYGGVGLGKTHLMHAIGHEVRRNNSMARVLYATSESFTNDLIESLRLGKMTEFRQKFRSLDVLMVDDVQFIINKQSVQEEFFNTFNTLHNAGKQIVISSDRPPKELTTLEERLRSRFEWGLIADIQKPDLETRIAILRNRAQQDNVRVDDAIIQYIAENVKSNIRELEGSLTRVLFFANINKRPVSMEVAREALKDIIPVQKKPSVTAELIKEAVAEYYDVPLPSILSQRRDKEVVVPRQVAMYLCHSMLSLPYKKTADIFGRSDHTTVINACKKINDRLEQDEAFRRTLEDIQSRLT